MPNLTPEKELQIREALAAKMEELTDSVYIRRFQIGSEQDFVDYLGKLNIDQEIEIRYIDVTLLRPVDSPTDGCDDNPAVSLIYNIHIFREFKEKRSDQSNSTDDFIALVLNLRNKFLQRNRSVSGIQNSEYTPLTFPSDIVLDVDTLTSVVGHSIDIQETIQIDF